MKLCINYWYESGIFFNGPILSWDVSSFPYTAWKLGNFDLIEATPGTHPKMNKMHCMRCLGSLFISTSKNISYMRLHKGLVQKPQQKRSHLTIFVRGPVPSETFLHPMRCFTHRVLRHCSKYKRWQNVWIKATSYFFPSSSCFIRVFV